MSSKTTYAFEQRIRNPGGANTQWWASEQPECPTSAGQAFTITENSVAMASRFPDCWVVFQELGLGGALWEVEPFDQKKLD
jgi:hypothetical protein